ncbi:MAG: triose-phosphate isomerase [Dehalococcoidia bacterium]|nr:triose-phosphate isomerase [Dehalococcoidia bacterium]
MRIPIVAGNWKMNTTIESAVGLVQEMKGELDKIPGIEKVLCPPFVSLSTVGNLIKGTSIELGAQNMYFEMEGAYTGEISPPMLKNLCQYIIIGHSERRIFFGETNEMVNKKLKAALKIGLIPILCVGENLKEKEAGKTEAVITNQVSAAMQEIASLQKTVIAYEPLWAIGSGKAASATQANTVLNLIRNIITKLYDEQTAQSIRLQYGGSVNSNNIGEFVEMPDIDGVLVGGASLKAAEFLSIVEQTSKIKQAK